MEKKESDSFIFCSVLYCFLLSIFLIPFGLIGLGVQSSHDRKKYWKKQT